MGKTAEELSRFILWRFFSLQRVALGHSDGVYPLNLSD